MALYDDYITHDDKPFAENINDALLLSNVFDMTVQVDAPEMFSNSTWVNTTSPRKCSVSVLQLKEALPSGVSVSTSNNKSVLTGTGTVKLGWYPNFNAFGKYKSISWTGTGTIKVNLKTTNGTTIANDIANGTITSESVELRKLQEIVIEIVLTNATLTGLSVVMENKQSTRYGATVGITDVTGLESRLSNIEGKDTQQDVQIASLINANDEICNYDLICSDYNPTVDSTVTVTCRVTDFYGEVVAGESVTLYCNGSSVSTSITNNQGLATWTVTVDALGLNSFSVANSKLAINVIGWREVTLPSSVTSYCNLYVNDALRLCDFKYYRTNYNFTKTSSITLHTGLIPEDYRPLVNVICASFNDVIVAGIITDGSLSVASSETGSKNINISATWHY